MQSSSSEITIAIDTFVIAFTTATVGGRITIRGQEHPLADTIMAMIKDSRSVPSFSAGLRLFIEGALGPAAGKIKISFQLPAASLVNVKICNVIGQEVVTLVNERRSAGFYNESWAARNLPAGIYFCRLETGRNILVQRLIVLP